MFGGQEHELTMRTAELIDDNAQQALELLIQYGTSSRTYVRPHRAILANHM
jgi:transportin-3